MSRADCLHTLGVDSDASWEVIRQAYKDLVRVWHPDRFQSDPQLQHRAEQHLQRINDAYLALKNSQTFEPRQAEPAPQQKPPECDPVKVRPSPRGGPRPLAWSRLLRWSIKAAWIALICLAPLLIGSFLVSALRVPSLEAILQNGQAGPAPLAPARFASPSADRPATAGELSNWARGQAMELWNSIPKIGERQPGRAGLAANGATPGNSGPSSGNAGASAPGTPANGTELLRARMSGGSQMWVINQGGQDAIAKLVEVDHASPVRAIFVQAKNRACIRHIAPGVYTLLAETGESWDASHARFQINGHTLGKNGPFQCIDLTAGHVTNGQCIDVSSADGASRPRSSIVLGNR